MGNSIIGCFSNTCPKENLKYFENRGNETHCCLLVFFRFLVRESNNKATCSKTGSYRKVFACLNFSSQQTAGISIFMWELIFRLWLVTSSYLDFQLHLQGFAWPTNLRTLTHVPVPFSGPQISQTSLLISINKGFFYPYLETCKEIRHLSVIKILPHFL